MSISLGSLSVPTNKSPGHVVTTSLFTMLSVCFYVVQFTSIENARAQGELKGPPTVSNVSMPQSVFIDDARFGKDPFYPHSKRRDNGLSGTRAVTGELPSGLFLKGLSGTKERRLALINNYTFAAGEEAEVRVNGHTYKLRCLEIRERSAVIAMDGMSHPKELMLRHGL